MIAGAIAAIAGTLLANQSEFVAPAFMSWQRSGELLVMTILGGVGSLWGAMLGAIVYLTLEEALSLLTDQTHVLIGPLLVVVALFGRRGLAGTLAPKAVGRRGVSPPLLRVERLAKSFGALAVTDDVSFSVDEGRLVALIGPNGAGKTTLINQLSGALQSDAGQNRLRGRRHIRARHAGARRAWTCAIVPDRRRAARIQRARKCRAGRAGAFRFELPLLRMRRAGGKR